MKNKADTFHKILTFHSISKDKAEEELSPVWEIVGQETADKRTAVAETPMVTSFISSGLFLRFAGKQSWNYRP